MIEAPVGLVIVIVGLCLWIAVSAGIATRVAEELTLANPIFIGCETVPWRPLQNSLRSWCRFEVRNSGLRSPLRVRLMGVRPALQINGMGGPLEPMMSASSPTGEVTIDQGESQKFDLFMMIRWKFRMPRRMVRESGDPKNPTLIQWGPRRRSQYLVLLLDNEEVEPSTPRYEFDVRAHAGSVVRDATFEVCLTPRGPLIRKLAG
jgi:hypothetical protein